ncbi:DUF4860 domain-containing protein [Eubacterium sp. 1001713B170207_170306_E7]|uniref:DUF4860 domain-containing protein n=1 Tax=Eubacterium sp. 1001713B170207_170306_E7 TaxID=2787097 RepID=UPI00189A8C28|nr:DUF4860 domain-containing protein [Eubacterium sp. 1001713B170207_170306_E7]
MFHNKQNESMLSTFVLPISLVCLFALSALVLTFLGSGSYKHIKANYDATSEATVAVSYLSTKVRQNNRENAITVVPGADSDRLEIVETIGDKLYWTVIYCQDGVLYESAFLDGQAGGAEANAMRIADLSALRVSAAQNGLLSFEVTGRDGVVHAFSQSIVGAAVEAGDAE